MPTPSSTLRSVLNAPRVRELMELEELNQNELAKKLEVAPSTLSEWLSGKTAPGKKKLARLAEVLDTEPEDLLLPMGPVSIGSNSVVYVYNVYNVAAGASVTTHIHNSGGGGSVDAGRSTGEAGEIPLNSGDENEEK